MAEAAPGTARPIQIATLGAAFSANKGAASMLQAVVDVLPDALGSCQIDVLTTYPSADEREKPEGVRLVGLRPTELVFPVLPLALLIGLVRLVGGSGDRLAKAHPAIQSLASADVALDLAGISFADGRPFPILAYNVLMTGVPLLLGTPVIKCSQAVGPFRSFRTRRAARLILPRLTAVLTRGDQTQAHAIELGLSNARRANDLAFLMKLPDAAIQRAKERLATIRIHGPFVIVMPSSVVKAHCDEIGLDYVAMMSDFLCQIRETHDSDILIAPHSARPGQPASRMNDLPVCEALHAAAADHRVRLLSESLRPAELRALIALSEALVTSRFHAMISALSTSTPLLLVGWSHKYGEVLHEFGLTELAIPYDRFTPSELAERFDLMWSQRADIAARINGHLPAIIDGARINIEVICDELQRGRC